MSSTRAQLIASLIANIRSGNADTMAAGVRVFENLMIAGLLNIVDDMNTDGGYLGIQGGLIDTSFIKSATPNGFFLKDDGTWSSVSQKVTAIATSTTPTPNIDTTDLFIVLAQASNPTFGAPTGTPVQGQKLAIRITDNATARTLAFNTIYRFTLGISAPTTTVISRPLYLFFEYNSTDVRWDCIFTTQASGSTYSGTTDQILINGSNVISIAPNYAPPLTSTRIGYGDGSNKLTSNSGLVFDDGTGSFKYPNQYSTSSQPGIAAGAAAGTSPTVSLVGTNKCGVITIITGAIGLVSGTLCIVTYSNSYAFPNGSVVITSGNTANGNTLQGLASETADATTFTITVPIALTALTTYKLNYHVEGY